MTLPTYASRLASINEFLPWRKAVERILADLNDRVARAAADAGTVVVWAGTGDLPAGLLLADGTTVLQEDYPALYDAIQGTYNTGGEGVGVFRLPDFTTAPEHGVWAIRT